MNLNERLLLIHIIQNMNNIQLHLEKLMEKETYTNEEQQDAHSEGLTKSFNITSNLLNNLVSMNKDKIQHDLETINSLEEKDS